MTNADKIRSMSNEELAEFVNAISEDVADTISFGSKEFTEVWEEKSAMMQWLESEED